MAVPVVSRGRNTGDRPVTDVEALRARGFRPIVPGEKREFFASRADAYGYEVVHTADKVWIRKMFRRRGETPLISIVRGPRITAGDRREAEMGRFLERYTQTRYAEGQRGLSERFPAYHLSGLDDDSSEPYRAFDAVLRILSRSSPERLPAVLNEDVLPAFFGADPQGSVEVVALDESVDRDFGFLRGGYAVQHYSIAEIQQGGRGAATLRAWDTAVPSDYLDVLLSILQVATYPHIPLFHGGPFGLQFVFLFSRPVEHVPAQFPRSWLDWARSDADFGREARNLGAVLGSDSEEVASLEHRRYAWAAPLPRDALSELLGWLIDRLNVLLREVADPANSETDGCIDFTFALELNLSLIRLMRRVLHGMATEEPPAGKFLAFEVADIIDQLSRQFRRTADTAVFKLLFNPIASRELIRRVLGAVPLGAREMILIALDDIYDDLQGSVIESIWVPGKVGEAGVRVKRADLQGERVEDIGEFVGTLLRVLRNTHHGYFTRGDQRARPSRYLALTNGNVPDSISSLPFFWLLALLADPGAFVGWSPLPVSAFH
jgi:hypothetical protein